MTNNDEIRQRSPYKRGADDGLLFGLLLTVIFFAGVFSVDYPVTGLIAAAGMLSVPFVIYKFLRRSYVADMGMTLLSSLWMQGIMIFGCGALISGIIATVYLKWVDPDFINARVADAIRLYRESDMPSGERMAETLEAMVKSHLIPSAVQIVVEMIWLSIFSGSLLSLLMALLARARSVGKTNAKR